jgi:hypothetical protein
VHTFAVSCCGSPSLLGLFSSSSALVIDITLLLILATRVEPSHFSSDEMQKLLCGCNLSIPLHLSVCFCGACTWELSLLTQSSSLSSCKHADHEQYNKSIKMEGFDCHHKSNIWMSWLMSCDSPSQLLDRRECSSFQAGKLLLLCWDAGPAFDPWSIATFSRFLAVMNLSLHLKTNLSRARAWESCALGTKELKNPSVLLQEIHGEIHKAQAYQ